ncbi:Di-copper centre-containing protein [Delitschia confertaspora ATCC 74209]|uniref:tyrosinase n=1 Tax=Delitschia confertaspora ATCC 74209 TaxID=1513339 RepID=A0A9P4MUD9_9PLEO|nr:Di-copper centre-containing protein [Delitschia confertaspora ATCC 74209]
MLFLCIVLAALLSAFAQGRPASPYIVDEIILTTGIGTGKQPNGAVPIRREIRDLQQNYPDTWNLYLLGLQSFQMVDQKDPLSFYQIAGIHGVPYVPWANAQGIPGKRTGYCPHQNVMFFGWHRAYLALYEQQLYKHVLNISQQFPEPLCERYATAADQFRIPYWDWAVENATVPDAILQPTVRVTGTDGQEQEIENPLHHFRFHPTFSSDFDGQWLRMNTTLRWPTSDLSTAESQNNVVVEQFRAYAQGMHDGIGNGFAAASSMNAWSYSWLEHQHGTVHYVIGGMRNRETSAGPQKTDGHMWPLEYSAFEPAFMLHHCNVDRLFDLWMQAHPDQFIEEDDIGYTGSFAIADRTVVDANTPLSPFWKTSNTFWTSGDVRDSTVFGYAYPETQHWNFASDELFRASVNASIAELYTPKVINHMWPGNAESSGGDMKHLVTDNSFTDWTIQTSALRSSLPNVFVVQFSFDGETSSDAVENVGTWNVLMPMGMKMPKASKDKAVGSVNLTPSLVDRIAAGKLADLDPKSVVPYLTKRLSWKVYSGDGTIVPSTQLQGLNVTVASTRVLMPADANTPLDASGKKTLYPDVTVGKSGGTKI